MGVAVEFLSLLRVYLSICDAIHHVVDISHVEFRTLRRVVKKMKNAYSPPSQLLRPASNNREAAAVFFLRRLRGILFAFMRLTFGLLYYNMHPHDPVVRTSIGRASTF